MCVFNRIIACFVIVFLFFNRFNCTKQAKMMYFCMIFPKNCTFTNDYIS